MLSLDGWVLFRFFTLFHHTFFFMSIREGSMQTGPLKTDNQSTNHDLTALLGSLIKVYIHVACQLTVLAINCDRGCLMPSYFVKLFKLLTHCILVDSSTVICWTSPFVIL